MSNVKRYTVGLSTCLLPDEVVDSANYAKLEAEAQALKAEISRLHSTMIAAAEEIHEHWDAHCDEEGYGPSNLMYRLEKCIDADYPGYTAGVFAQLREEVAALRARVVVVPDSILPHRERSSVDPGFNEALRQVARLNGKTVSEGLLRRIDLVLAALRSHDFHGTIASTIGDNWRDEVDGMRGGLRELLVEGKEVGDE